MYSQKADLEWKRLARTVDLTGASSASLQFQISYNTELDWDFVVVEAHEVGSDQWTTLSDTNGHTSDATGDSCASGWVDIHPFVAHYQGADCSSTGSTGSWNAASGSSGGWQQWNVDLTAYAGKQVEVSVTYITDWGTQGSGVFVDDATVVVDGTTAHETSFEGRAGRLDDSGATGRLGCHQHLGAHAGGCSTRARRRSRTTPSSPASAPRA